jgi:uncharacterized membrane protein
MSTETIIYLASISSNVQLVCVLVGICLFVPIIALPILSFEKQYRNDDYSFSLNARIGMRVSSIILSLVAILLFVITALIPDEDDFYKIAGINEIQKANIDAQGQIIQETKNIIDSTGIVINKDHITIKLNK